MDPTKSIEEQEGEIWSRPELNSHVAQETYRLRKVPVCKLSVDDLRFLVGQKISLEILVPIAIELLEKDPLVGGSYYRGDLLSSVVGIAEEFWAGNPELNNCLVELRVELQSIAETTNDLLKQMSTLEFR